MFRSAPAASIRGHSTVSIGSSPAKITMLPVPSGAWGKNSVASPVVSDFAICATNCPLPTPPSPQSSVISPRCRNPEASFSHFLGVTLLSRRSTPPSWASISSTRPSPMAGAVGSATGAVSCTTPSSATCAFRGNCSRFVSKMSFFSMFTFLFVQIFFDDVPLSRCFAPLSQRSRLLRRSGSVCESPRSPPPHTGHACQDVELVRGLPAVLSSVGA